MTVQNAVASTGTVTFNGNVTLDDLITFAEPYLLVFNGATNAFSSLATFNNTGGLSFGNNGTSQFNNGLTYTVGAVSLGAALVTSGAPILLNTLNLTGAASITTAGGDMTFVLINGGSNSLTLDAGTAGNVTFNGNGTMGNLLINQVNNLTNHATLTVATYQQNAGNVTNLGTHTLNVVGGNASITSNSINGNVVVTNGNVTLNANSVNTSLTVSGTASVTAATYLGTVNVGGLSISISQYMNINGSVGGATGLAAIAKINFVTPPPGMLFFDGIDLSTFSKKAAANNLNGIVQNIFLPQVISEDEYVLSNGLPIEYKMESATAVSVSFASTAAIMAAQPAAYSQVSGSRFAPYELNSVARFSSPFNFIGEGWNAVMATVARWSTLVRAGLAVLLSEMIPASVSAAVALAAASIATLFHAGMGALRRKQYVARVWSALARGVNLLNEIMVTAYAAIMTPMAKSLSRVLMAWHAAAQKIKPTAYWRVMSSVMMNIMKGVVATSVAMLDRLSRMWNAIYPGRTLSATWVATEKKLRWIVGAVSAVLVRAIALAKQLNPYRYFVAAYQSVLAFVNRLATRLNPSRYVVSLFVAVLSGLRSFSSRIYIAIAATITTWVPATVSALGHKVIAPIKTYLYGVSLLFVREKYLPRAYSASLSFTMRTSLNNMIGFAELIRDGKLGSLTAQQKESIDDILHCSDEMRALTRRVEKSHRLSSTAVKQMTFMLRTLLDSIVGFAGMIKEEKVGTASPQLQEAISYIINSADDVLSLVRDMTDRISDKALGLNEQLCASVATMSFNMRTSLSSITGFTEILLSEVQGPISSRQKEYLTDMLMSANILHQYVVQQVEPANDMSYEMLTQAAFNLRTALSGVLGFAQLIYDGQAGPLSQTNKEYVSYIIASSNETMRMVHELALRAEEEEKYLPKKVMLY